MEHFAGPRHPIRWQNRSNKPASLDEARFAVRPRLLLMKIVGLEPGRRAVALDKHTIEVLRAHRRRQLDQRAQAADHSRAWTDTGYVFTRADGQPINPNYATTRFRKLVQRAALASTRPREHDLPVPDASDDTGRRSGACSFGALIPFGGPASEQRERNRKIELPASEEVAACLSGSAMADPERSVA